MRFSLSYLKDVLYLHRLTTEETYRHYCCLLSRAMSSTFSMSRYRCRFVLFRCASRVCAIFYCAFRTMSYRSIVICRISACGFMWYSRLRHPLSCGRSSPSIVRPVVILRLSGRRRRRRHARFPTTKLSKFRDSATSGFRYMRIPRFLDFWISGFRGINPNVPSLRNPIASKDF